MLEQLEGLATFAALVEAGSITGAARRLGVPKSTVSRRLSRLEEALDVRLVQRTTRQCRLTDEGRDLFEQVAAPLAALSDAGRRMADQQDSLRGRVRLTAPVDMGQLLLPEVLAEFALAHPEIEVEVDLSGRMVNLVEEGFDLALRAGRLADSTLVARRLASEGFRLVASPAFLSANPVPTAPADLSTLPTVRFRPLGPTSHWRLTDGAQEVTVEVGGPLSSNDFGFIRQAALFGSGVALLPVSLIAPDLTAGRLVTVLPNWQLAIEGAALHLVYPSARQLPARVRVLRDHLLKRLPERLGSPGQK